MLTVVSRKKKKQEENNKKYSKMYDKEIEDIQYKVPIKHKTSNNGKIEEQKGIRHIENKI